ncbi:UNVERIFIED_CONTAM: hypothetical protein NCL1_16321 [Trichonephila clavipes]
MNCLCRWRTSLSFITRPSSTKMARRRPCWASVFGCSPNTWTPTRKYASSAPPPCHASSMSGAMRELSVEITETPDSKWLKTTARFLKEIDQAQV